MALAKKTSNSTRLIVISAIILVVAGVGYFLFREFFLKTDVDSNENGAASRRKSVLTNFGDTILQDPRYRALKSFDVPVQVDVNSEGGQTEPFR